METHLQADHTFQDYFVEVDVVMSANTELWRAHDIAQKLQDQIEVLPRVERAFVHVDHESTHRPVSIRAPVLCSNSDGSTGTPEREMTMNG
jgi:divalent metal cation (Fe/Co/Zn/Cd) transporter